MSNAHALTLIPSTYSEMQSISESFAKSSLLPEALRGKAADVFVQIAAGAELGLPPMASIRGVHIVQGKPVLAADTMVAIVLGSGLAEYFMCVAESDASVTYETKRRGAPVAQRTTWTWEDTKRAGLNTKENHRLHGRQMMKARAKAILARDAYPDVLAGCYDPDEVDHSSSQSYTPPTDAIDVETVDTSDVLRSALADIEKTSTEEALKAQSKSIKDLKLDAAGKSEVNAAYSAKLKLLRQSPPVVTNGVNHAEPTA